MRCLLAVLCAAAFLTVAFAVDPACVYDEEAEGCVCNVEGGCSPRGCTGFIAVDDPPTRDSFKKCVCDDPYKMNEEGYCLIPCGSNEETTRDDQDPCQDTPTPKCDDKGFCVECFEDADCSPEEQQRRDGSEPVCVKGFCQCATGQVFDSNAKECVAKTCGETQYLDGDDCVDCTSPCMKCTGANVCSSCVEGYNLDKDNHCIQCATGQVFDSNAKECVAKTCGETQYLDGDDCVDCTSPCMKCTGANVCSSCVEGYNLDKDNHCIQCATGQVFDSEKPRSVWLRHVVRLSILMATTAWIVHLLA